ncbi:P-loop NTPase fold protein [Kribbella monticola]|uniref:P-loop NTPase fold protein n=1 Tax=Kribbella monticola TaxID=2185285 RepID=UPI000DD3CF51|nr:P-loop NTPase fold protein [Kribbella monticola]
MASSDTAASSAFAGHAEANHALVMSPDGRFVITGSRKGAVRFWSVSDGVCVHDGIGAHRGYVQALALSEDGRLLASGGNDDVVLVWEVETRTIIRRLAGHGELVTGLSFSPDASALIATRLLGESRLMIWKLDSDAAPEIWNAGPNVYAAAYLPGSRHVLTISSGSVAKWDLSTRAEETSFPGSPWPFGAVYYEPEQYLQGNLAQSPDGRLLAASNVSHRQGFKTEGTTCTVWDLRTGQVQSRIADDPTFRAHWLCFGSDSTKLYAACSDSKIRVWDAGSAELLTVLDGHTSFVHAIDRAGDVLASTGDDGAIHIWSESGRQKIRTIEARTGGRMTCVSVDSNADVMATGGYDGVVRVWNFSSGRLLARLAFHGSWIRAVKLIRDGRYLVTSGAGTAAIWQVTTGELVRSVQAPGWIMALDVTRDGRRVIAACSAALICWDIDSGTVVWSREVHDQVRWTLRVHPDRPVFAFGGQGSDIEFHAVESGALIGTVARDDPYVYDLAFSDDKLLAVGGGGRISSYRLQLSGAGEVTGAFPEPNANEYDEELGARRLTHPEAPRLLAVAPFSDRRRIATAGASGAVTIWELAAGRVFKELEGHTDWVCDVAVSDDEVTTVGHDGTIRVWEIATGQQLRGTDRPDAVLRNLLTTAQSDEPSSVDLLGVAHEVRALSTLVAARTTSPPMAIAVLGSWGSGKSSFMMQMQEEVQRLSPAVASEGQSSSFISGIRQVRFNAWHYNSGNVWPGLIRHLFEELAVGGVPIHEQVDITAERARVETDIAEKADERAQLVEELALLDQEGRSARLSSRRGLRRLARVIARRIRDGWRSLTASGLALGGLYAIWRWTSVPEWILGIGTVLSLSQFVPVLNALLSYRRKLRGLIDAEQKASAERLKEVSNELENLQNTRRELSQGEALQHYINNVSTDQSYVSRAGIIGKVHDDLATLQMLIAQTATAGFEPGDPSIQRIVLYIDDLDRCSPQCVVDTLDAVHLLLAIPLFVVVVGVDPNWLLRSLELHSSVESSLPTDDREPALKSANTALDYLDKIFQIPFVLRPLGEEGGRYLAKLLDDASPDEGPVASSASAAPAPAADAANDEVDFSSGVRPQRPSQPVTRSPGVDTEDSGPQQEPENPKVLRLRAAETDFIPHLGPLLPTPRSAKKLINLYRLMRIAMPERELAAWLGDQEGGRYQVALLLLALLTGRPTVGRALLDNLLTVEDGGSEAVGEEDIVPFLERMSTRLAAQKDPLHREIDRFRRLIEDIRGHTPVRGSVREFQSTGRRVARLSFYTRYLV